MGPCDLVFIMQSLDKRNAICYMYAKLLDMRELKPEKGVELAMSDKRRITIYRPCQNVMK